MELNIDCFIIEVTRKCNMNCEHCLRGPSQRKIIDNRYIYKMFQLIDNVTNLSITGGEPTLAIDSLEQIRHCIIYGNCDVDSFSMVTNGKSINVENIAAWVSNMFIACSYNETSGISFSFDQFHINSLNREQINKQKRNFYNLKEILEYKYGIYEMPVGGDFVHEHSNNSWGYNHLLKEGRAKDFGLRDNDIRLFEIEDCGGTGDIIWVNEAELYLSCSGYIVAGCDWSYYNMDNNKDIRVGHIDDINCTDDLIEAIEVYNKKAEKTLQYA